MLTVLSLFDYSGEWCKPYRNAGYDVRQVDLKHGDDVVMMKDLGHPVRGILAAPPCTEFASSGARWWADKGDQPLREALALVDAVFRLVWVHRPMWWALENPVGRLAKYLGPPRLVFDPADYGDPYTKKTCLWGDFAYPIYRPVEATEGSKMHLMPPSPDRAEKRSITPAGFAQAFFDANP